MIVGVRKLKDILKRNKFGDQNSIFYFLGNVPEHISHALPLYGRLGGTFIVLSRKAYDTLVALGVRVVMMDDRPDLFLQFPPKEINNTVKFINKNAKIVIFYETFTCSNAIHVPQVMLTHGNTFKDYYVPWRQKILPYYTFVAGIGPYMEKKLVRAGLDRKKILKVGMARTDAITGLGMHRKTKRKLLKKIGLNPNRPTVCYIPTWWGPSSVWDVGLSIIKNIPNEYNIIFRPHPSTAEETVKEYQDVVNSKSHAKYLPDSLSNSIDINTIILLSDVFIADMSGVVLDVILIKKPLIFAFGNGDHAQSINAYRPIKSIFKTSPRVNASNVRSIGRIIESVTLRPVNESIYEDITRKFYYADEGHNVDKLIDAIKAIVKDSK